MATAPAAVSANIKKLLGMVEGLNLTNRLADNAIELYYGDQTFVHDCVRSWKKISAVNSGLRGSFGVVHKVNVDGKDYIVKGVMQPKIRTFDSVNELIMCYNLTMAVPDSVSNLLASGLQYNDDIKSLNLWLIFESPNGKDLNRYIKDDISAIIGTQNTLLNKIYCSIKSAQRAVNSAGYVHRDIKPANIFVELNPDGTFLRCKLIDLGATIKSGSIVPFEGTPLYSPYHIKAIELSTKAESLKSELTDIENEYKLIASSSKNSIQLNRLKSKHSSINSEIKSLEQEFPKVIQEGLQEYESKYKKTTSVAHNNFSVDTIWTKDFKQSPGTQPRFCIPAASIAPISPNGRHRLPPMAQRPTLAQLANATKAVTVPVAMATPVPVPMAIPVAMATPVPMATPVLSPQEALKWGIHLPGSASKQVNSIKARVLQRIQSRKLPPIKEGGKRRYKYKNTRKTKRPKC
jgi:hypothetical protein